MAKKRAFISFDYDHDVDIKTMFVGQGKHPDTPFEIVDLSIKEAISSAWKAKARTRIKGCDVVIVLCGEYTHTATGVSAELQIAQEEKVPYFLVAGYPDKNCTKPAAALPQDKVYRWTWENIKNLLNGSR